MTRIKMHIFKVKLPFYPPSEVKCRLQNEVSTHPAPHLLQFVHFFLIKNPAYILEITVKFITSNQISF